MPLPPLMPFAIVLVMDRTNMPDKLLISTASMNVDSSFEPIGMEKVFFFVSRSLSEELHACKSVHGIGEAAATVGSNLACGPPVMWLYRGMQSTVWMTMLIKSAALVALGVRFEDYGFTSASHSCYMIGFGLALITGNVKRDIVEASSLIVEWNLCVGVAIQENQPNSPDPAEGRAESSRDGVANMGCGGYSASAVRPCLLGRFCVLSPLNFGEVSGCIFAEWMFAFASVSSFFVWELRRNNTLSALAFAWASAFLRSGRLLVVASSTMRGVVGGYVVGQAGESVVTMGAYVFALVLGMLAWEYVDGVEEFHTLSQAAQTLSVIFSDFLPEFMTPFLTGLFVACGAHLLFGFLGEVILAALNAIYFCYCIDLDEARRRHTRRRGGKEKIALGELFEQLEENEGFPPRPSAPPLATSGHYEGGYREEDEENKWVPPSNLARGGRGTSYGGGGEQERKAATGGRPSAPPLDDDLPAGTVLGSERTQKKYDTFD
eukprot:jgi/Bigna1/79233/fgenesh1_pg.60_\